MKEAKHLAGSVGLLCMVVGVAAVECAWLRYSFLNRCSLLGLYAPAFDAGVLPMANVSGLGLYICVLKRGRASRFLVGFVASGFLAVLAFVVSSWLARFMRLHGEVSAMLRPIYVFWSLCWTGYPSDAYLYFADSVYFSIPQFLFALAGGLTALRVCPAPSVVSSDRSRQR